LIALGVPASKLQIGVPFYGRGWTGVAPGPNGDGLYQTASGAAKGTYEAGFEDYKVLKTAAGTLRTHAITGADWKYDGSNFWTYDTPTTIQNKAAYAKAKGLGGIFSWEADGDVGSELVNAMATINQ
jgi:chitinase